MWGHGLASGQETTPPKGPAPAPSTPTPGGPTPTRPTPEATPGGFAVPSVQTPGVLFPPFVGPDLLTPPVAQGPLVFTPSFTLSEEFNDNIFSDNRNKESDFITGFSPGLRLDMRQPGFTMGVGYTFTAEIYAKHTELSNAANRQRLFGNLSYQPTQRLSFALDESLSYDRNTNAASVEGISSGRQAAWTNVLAPSLQYQITPRLGSRLYGSWELQRFDAGGQDSNTYRVGTGLDYALTPRLNVNGGYEFAYLDIQDEPKSYTHTPRVGFTYQITQTLSAGVTGGPSFLVSEGDTSVSPAVTAIISQTQRWGGISFAYDRAIRAAGGQGGPADTQSFTGNVAVTTLARGFTLGFSPRYTISNSEDVARSRSDIKALTLNLNANYQIARYVSIVGSYTFFNQRTDGGSGSSQQVDVDQNRVFLGLQFGYPISFY